MTTRDVFQTLDTADAATIDMIVTRMELRGRDPRFVAMRRAYLDRLDLANVATFLDFGCGTGLDARAAAARPEFKGKAMGVDLSPGMIEAGKKLAAQEGVPVELWAGDAARVDMPDASFDAIAAHTLVSHVESPLAVLREAARLLRPTGRLVIFDADFASLSFGYPDAVVARQMQDALLQTFVANPRVMRQLPGLLPQAGLMLTEVLNAVVADVGKGQFFVNMADTYAPRVSAAGLLPAATVDAWLQEQHASADAGRLFASLTFYAYILKKT